MAYKLSQLAAEDFSTIFEYTLLTFGTHQADRYTQDLEATFHLLFEAPGIGVECPEIGNDVRRHDHNKHAIFYRKREMDIYIIRILHQQMEPMRHLFK